MAGSPVKMGICAWVKLTKGLLWDRFGDELVVELKGIN